MNKIENKEEFIKNAKTGDVFLFYFGGNEKYDFEYIKGEDFWITKNLNTNQDYSMHNELSEIHIQINDTYIHLQSDLFDIDMENLLK